MSKSPPLTVSFWPTILPFLSNRIIMEQIKAPPAPFGQFFPGEHPSAGKD
jgi:hypothetical protein